jgi:hypothetical protein
MKENELIKLFVMVVLIGITAYLFLGLAKDNTIAESILSGAFLISLTIAGASFKFK